MMTNPDVRRNAPSMTTDGWLALGLIALDIVARLTPHAPNFTPVAASALFAGAVFGSRTLAFVVPLAAMALSDCVLGFSGWPVMIAVYVSITMPAALGLLARRSATPLRVFPLMAASSAMFFIASNFAVWMFSGMYALDTAGLVKCYVAALPFFQNTLMGDLFWTMTLFGGLWIWQSVFAAHKRRSIAA